MRSVKQFVCRDQETSIQLLTFCHLSHILTCEPRMDTDAHGFGISFTVFIYVQNIFVRFCFALFHCILECLGGGSSSSSAFWRAAVRAMLPCWRRKKRAFSSTPGSV